MPGAFIFARPSQDKNISAVFKASAGEETKRSGLLRGRGRGYGHWLVRVPPELVVGVGEVSLPPLPMEGVALRSLPPDPTWEVWLTAQQASPFLSSLTT